MLKYRTALLTLPIVYLLSSFQPGYADNHLTPELQKMTVEQRNLVYAPWDPNDMDDLRKEVGLIGPGTNTPFPEARFPGYLKMPENIGQLMPQAQYAVQQKGGRTPLGLVDPGDIVLLQKKLLF